MAHLDSLAQLVEQLTFNQWVTGSSPVRVILLAGLATLYPLLAFLLLLILQSFIKIRGRFGFDRHLSL